MPKQCSKIGGAKQVDQVCDNGSFAPYLDAEIHDETALPVADKKELSGSSRLVVSIHHCGFSNEDLPKWECEWAINNCWIVPVLGLFRSASSRVGYLEFVGGRFLFGEHLSSFCSHNCKLIGCLFRGVVYLVVRDG